MVLCSYFLKGTCRYGNACKNEHSYNENASSVLLKKNDIDITALVKSASGDMLKAEKGNQWPLSCYGPFQAKPCFPGFEDKCFEEIRLGYYEAQRSGTIEQYKEQLALHLQEARMKMKSLQNPTPEATNMLREIYEANTSNQKSIFGNQNVFTNNTIPQQNSIFGNNPQVHTNNIFATPLQPNVTSAPPVSSFTFTLPENKSIFGNTQAAPQSQPFLSSGSIFASTVAPNAFPASTPIVGAGSNTPSIFGNAAPQTTAPFATKSIFQSPNPVTNQSPITSIFGNPQSSSTPINSPTFNNSPFGPLNNSISTSPFTNKDSTAQTFVNTNTAAPKASPFHNAPISTTPQTTVFNIEKSQSHSTSIFGNRPPLLNTPTNRRDDPSVYSKICDLTSNDIAQFEKSNFEFGNIPSRAPPLEMC